ncbi:uncharacterized protein BDV14DRAFT_23823 [Aspergillus stella-maris]|uniref:uncharacterized protein n=1 Tax=Aspergillus stella-maris TaxID=1810926 RepID=UPI003CCDE8D4
MVLVYISNDLLKLNARPALESFYEHNQRDMACLDPSLREEYIEYLLGELTDSTLLFLSLFTWDIRPDAFSYTYWMRMAIPLSPLERSLLAESLRNPRLEQDLDPFYHEYRQLVVGGLNKQGFELAIEILPKRLHFLFKNYLQASLDLVQDLNHVLECI